MASSRGAIENLRSLGTKGSPAMMWRPLRVFLGSNDFAVTHVNDTIAICGGFRVMRDHEDCLSKILIRLAQHVEDNARTLRIQVAGGLIGEHDGGTIDEGAGERNSLLLATGKFIGAVLQALSDTEHLRNFLEECRVRRAKAGDVRGDLDIRTRA